MPTNKISAYFTGDSVFVVLGMVLKVLGSNTISITSFGTKKMQKSPDIYLTVIFI